MKKWFLAVLSAVMAFSFVSCKTSSSDNSGLLALFMGGSGVSVVSTTPVNNATGVGLNSSIMVNFSEDILSSSVTTTTFQMSPAVSGSFNVIANSVTFAPDADLSASTIYTVTLTTGIESAVTADKFLKSSYSFSFTTGTTADLTAPTVSSTLPASNAINVAINSSITITFSESIDPATVTGNYDVSGTASVTCTTSVTGATLTITPSADLDYATFYTVTLSAGGISDLAGNPLTPDYVFYFTTSNAPDTTGPTVVMTSPLNGASGVSVHTPVGVYFSENIRSGSVNTANFAISPSVAGAFSFPDNATVVFTPNDALEYNTEYTITLAAGGIEDVAHNGLQLETVFSFTTEATPDVTPPTITNYTPVDESTGVTLNPTIMIYFSEAILESSITSAAFTVTYNDGTVHEVAGTYGIMEMAGIHLATWTPTSSLSLDTEYTVTLTEGGITDLAGNGWTGSGDLVFTFTTKVSIDTTPPTVTSTSPADGASITAASITMPETNYALIQIMFSDEMNADSIATYDGGGILLTSNIELVRGATAISANPMLFPGDSTGRTVMIMCLASDLTAGDYTVTITGGSGGVANSDGYEMAVDYVFDFTITE